MSIFEAGGRGAAIGILLLLAALLLRDGRRIAAARYVTQIVGAVKSGT